MNYEIKYTGTPPKAQRFKLNANLNGLVITIRFTKPGALAVLDSNGN
jgi:hypothetical protein